MPSAPASRDLANAIRALSMDAVQKANSGHPGAPMGMADIAEVLWRGFMQHNPADLGLIEHHLQADSVLDRTSGIAAFQLDPYR